jgi:OmpA-OmpF porin, OOP family
MTIDGKGGKWLRAFQGNTYLSGNKESFGENFTVEFDMIYFFEPKTPGYVLPTINFGLLSSGEMDNADNQFLKEQNYYNSTEIAIHPYGNGGARVVSGKNRGTSFSSDRITLNDYQKDFNKVLHYSLQVQKQRLRIWINEAKVFDIPRAINLGDTLNQIFFNLEGSNYKDEEIGVFISNIKIATGLPDTRHKLIEEGKFSTTGILFDAQSAVIKPESFGMVKEIATVLKENGSVNIKIIGHTSSDGDDAANLELSKQRAAAVKDLLVKEYGIEEGRLKTEGKGETQPVADNKTKEGKAQNRRVEFVKE